MLPVRSDPVWKPVRHAHLLDRYLGNRLRQLSRCRGVPPMTRRYEYNRPKYMLPGGLPAPAAGARSRLEMPPGARHRGRCPSRASSGAVFRRVVDEVGSCSCQGLSRLLDAFRKTSGYYCSVSWDWCLRFCCTARATLTQSHWGAYKTSAIPEDVKIRPYVDASMLKTEMGYRVIIKGIIAMFKAYFRRSCGTARCQRYMSDVRVDGDGDGYLR